MKVTQYECNNLRSPGQDCLQYLTASTGDIASFNWDTSSTSVSSSQYHLSDQYYDICIRYSYFLTSSSSGVQICPGRCRFFGGKLKKKWDELYF